jgi:Clp amino terminal domain, pathogenicity island component
MGVAVDQMLASDTHALLDAATRLEDPSDGLNAVCALRKHLDQLQTVHVENALRAGWSWSQVAEALGVSRQAAHRRYARVVRERLDEVRDSSNGAGTLTVTGAARLAMHLGRQEAEALLRPQLGTEHVLLGLLRLDAGPARTALRDAGVELTATRAAVVELHAEDPADDVRFSREPLSPSRQCRAALERSVHEAARRGEDRLRPEHLLVALLADAGSGAVRTLTRLGIDAEALAATV